jgi:hypothetical protein
MTEPWEQAILDVVGKCLVLRPGWCEEHQSVHRMEYCLKVTEFLDMGEIAVLAVERYDIGPFVATAYESASEVLLDRADAAPTPEGKQELLAAAKALRKIGKGYRPWRKRPVSRGS